jgi:hypothetical protein
MHGVVMLETEYFSDNPTHKPKVLWQHFRMNKELIMKIVISARKYSDYLIPEKELYMIA